MPVVTNIWNMKNIFIILRLSVECERFNAAMRDVQSTCVLRMNATDCSSKTFSLNNTLPYTRNNSCIVLTFINIHEQQDPKDYL